MHWLYKSVSIAPLVVFRVVFGLLMFASNIRFAANGWIQDFYLTPTFHFKFYGFEWVALPANSIGVYAIFIIMGLAALCVALGAFYRFSIVLFFICFTYIELVDVTYYLNHYYLVSLLSFLLIFVPAANFFSLDVYFGRVAKKEQIPLAFILIFQLQLAIVYFYAGLAKLNYDWLVEAMPLKIWLLAKIDFPVLGMLFQHTATAFVFSWLGALFDLFIVLFLCIRQTRFVAYGVLVIFHLLTYLLFPIGMFPFVMIASTLVFFSDTLHLNLMHKIGTVINVVAPIKSVAVSEFVSPKKQLAMPLLLIFGIYFFIQLLLPWRFVLYPSNIYCTEQGYRFSWRVMLMEKTGNTTFTVKEKTTGKSWEIENKRYLTPLQEKMMATQPDMILQFAHYLISKLAKDGYSNLEIFANSYATVNGRGSRLLIDPNVNLALQKENFKHKNWVLPCE
jgi:hypothetical protein